MLQRDDMICRLREMRFRLSAAPHRRPPVLRAAVRRWLRRQPEDIANDEYAKPYVRSATRLRRRARPVL